jgi:coenzyme F420-reducing hydrogenase alpha subunit
METSLMILSSSSNSNGFDKEPEAPNSFEYVDHVAEHVESRTYLKFPYLKKRGWKGFKEGIDSSIYRASPQAYLTERRGARPRATQ